MIVFNRKLNTKGFSLAELLIVVAIIAVLVAIAIPVFSNSVERAKESTDLSNIRSAYAKVLYSALDDIATVEDGAQGADPYSSVIKYTENGKQKYKAYTHVSQKVSGWQSGDFQIEGIEIPPYDSKYENNSPRYVIIYDSVDCTTSIFFEHD